jgi:ankyrin repeat protein
MPTRTEMSAADTAIDPAHTHLMYAALEGQTQIVKALLDRGADVNTKDSQGRTALMVATINLHTDTVRLL